MPLPKCPWSHITIDLIMDLSDPRHNSIIMVVTLPSLPTSFETTALIFNHAIPYFGIPEDVVSESG